LLSSQCIANIRQSPTVDATRVNRYIGAGFSDTIVMDAKKAKKKARFKK
jgi:hypothetical protein